MTKKEIEARESIIEATIALIREHGDVSQITMRDIAARANVGTGLVNYHFQTKENLINICVQRIIEGIIGHFDPLYKSLDMKPMEKLRFLVKTNMKYLMDNPGISRISILSDLQNGSSSDNTIQTMEVYKPVLREVMGSDADESEVLLRLHVLISCFQAAFLRREVLKENFGMDYTDAAHREVLADRMIDIVMAGFDK